MIMGAEIGMLVLGLIALATGKLRLGKKRVVTGPLAKQLGMVLLLPIPATWLLKAMVDMSYVSKGRVVPDASNTEYLWALILIEGLVVIACLAVVYALGWDKGIDPSARPADLPFAEVLPDQSGPDIAEDRFSAAASTVPGPERPV
jgi:hypothetical protein